MKYAILNGQKVYKVQETPTDIGVSCPQDVEAGWLYLNGQFIPPPGSLVYEKLRKQKEINNQRTIKLAEPVLFKNSYFDTNQNTIINLTAAISAFNSGLLFPDEYYWRTVDNQNVLLSLEELTTLLQLITSKVNNVYSQSWNLKQQVEEATTLDEVYSIVW